MSPDPWSAFLEWLNTVLVPNWGELIALLPYVLVGMVVGPILTLIVLMWAWHLLRRRRGRVRRVEVQPVSVPRGADGLPAFPVNVPYCVEHGWSTRPGRGPATSTALTSSWPARWTVRSERPTSRRAWPAARPSSSARRPVPSPS